MQLQGGRETPGAAFCHTRPATICCTPLGRAPTTRKGERTNWPLGGQRRNMRNAASLTLSAPFRQNATHATSPLGRRFEPSTSGL